MNLKNKISKDVMSKKEISSEENERKIKAERISFCEENLKKNINFLLDQGLSLEEIIGLNTSLLVIATSSESIKRRK